MAALLRGAVVAAFYALGYRARGREMGEKHIVVVFITKGGLVGFGIEVGENIAVVEVIV